MPTLQLLLLGALGVHCDDQLLPRPPTLKSQSLLAYLATHRRWQPSRERLSDRFGGDRPERKPCGPLPTALWQIRLFFPDRESMLSDPHSVPFDPDRLSRKTPLVWLTGCRADYPDPDSFLRCSTWRVYTHWQNEAFEGLVEGARRITNQEERMRIYWQADGILQEAPVVPLKYTRIHLPVKPWVSRCPASASGWWFWKDVVIDPH